MHEADGQNTDPVVRVRNLGKKFGEFTALKGIDLDIHPSEVVCIIGPSGSGKSTLLRCMSFLEDYSAGEVRIEGQLLGYRDTPNGRVRDSERAIDQVRRNVGMVFQHFNLWPHMTALGNTMLGLRLTKGMARRDAQRIGREALARVGLEAQADRYPSQLSGGQQQRVAIARALAMSPHIMLFDEPTSALDPQLVGEVLDTMRQLAGDGMTMGIVTHEMGFAAQVANRVIFMDEGEIVEQGPPRELFLQPRSARLREFLDTWMQRNALFQGETEPGSPAAADPGNAAGTR